MTKKLCKHCGKEFENGVGIFCSQKCKDDRIIHLKNQLKEAVEQDKGHTQGFSTNS